MLSSPLPENENVSETQFSELLLLHLSKGTRPGGAEGKAWTRKEFSVALNVKASTVSRWLSGDYLPHNMYSIARTLFGTINPRDDPSLMQLEESLRREKVKRLQK